MSAAFSAEVLCPRPPPEPAQLPYLEGANVACSPFQVLFSQFRYFFNFYFLLLACSQFVPEMRLGALYTYWVPLVSRSASGLQTESSLFLSPGHLGLHSGFLRDVVLLSQHAGHPTFSI